jgi:hypothetical protein
MAINEKSGNLYQPSRLTRDLAGWASASRFSLELQV